LILAIALYARKNRASGLGMVAHTSNSSTQEAEAGDLKVNFNLSYLVSKKKDLNYYYYSHFFKFFIVITYT
jgi:hypothetical protein